MTIVAINTFNIGSTGKIMLQIAELARDAGNKYYTCCPRARDNYKKQVSSQILIGNRVFRNIHVILSVLFGLEGCFSIVSTLNFIRKLKVIKPDVIHLHNIHGSYINYYLLFKYIKKENIKVVWTLHDCWSFTGRCPHFTAVKCDKWKRECKTCPYPSNAYPSSYLDTSRMNYRIKKKSFSGVKDLQIVTPSAWLAALVKESYLGNYSIEVINNGIDLNVFRPYPSDFRTKYGIEESFIILGVAFNWDYRKGLDVFIELAQKLNQHYKIVLVGTNEETEERIPNNVITIRRTDNQKQLAEIYSAADVFINPTREDNYPTVNMESIACGTPVITFETGGSPEVIDEGCGEVVPVNDIQGVIRAIQNIESMDRRIVKNKCIKSSKRFESRSNMEKYIQMYEQ